MTSTSDLLQNIRKRVQVFGLDMLAVVRAEGSELAGLGLREPASIILVGSFGSTFWPGFSCSNECLDGKQHSLDRWSKRVGESIAEQHGCSVLFPSEGPPYWPFLSWAERAGLSATSQLGVHIHKEYGLWHAYRFALVASNVEYGLSDTTRPRAISRCDTCYSQPCLRACPVEAFSPGHYDVDKCASYLKSKPDAECNKRGCLARRACPVAQEYQYHPEHAAFHMQAFVRAHTNS
ncbi:MAG: hypothetical protein AB8B86_06250 [Pseudomonadales bacterium]